MNEHVLIETLYRTDRPEELEFADYCQVRVDPRFINGEWRYFVTEKHGWWDPERKQPVAHISTLNPQDSDAGYLDVREAIVGCEAQQHHRAKEGYVHVFYLDLFEGQKYRRLQP